MATLLYNVQFNKHKVFPDYDVLLQKLKHLESEKKEYVSELKSVKSTNNKELTDIITRLKNQQRTSRNESKLLSQQFLTSFNFLENECSRNDEMELIVKQNISLINRLQQENDALLQLNKKYESELEHVHQTMLSIQIEKGDIAEQFAQKVDENEYLSTRVQLLHDILISMPVHHDSDNVSLQSDKEDTAEVLRLRTSSKPLLRSKTYENETDISDLVFIKQKSKMSLAADCSVDYQHYMEMEVELQYMENEMEVLNETCHVLKKENEVMTKNMETLGDKLKDKEVKLERYKIENHRLMQVQHEYVILGHRLNAKSRRIAELQTMVNELSVDPAPRCYVLPKWMQAIAF